MKTEIHLWLDRASGDEPAWVVSRDTGDHSQTVATFGEGDYADALTFAKDECQRTGYPVIEVGQHGERRRVRTMAEHVFRINNSPDGDGRYCYVGDIGQPDLRVRPDDRIAGSYPDTDEEVEGWPEAADTHPELFDPAAAK